MTDAQSGAYPMLGLGRRFNPARDLSRTAFRDEDMALYDLFVHHMRAGRAMIEGITFTGCRIEGPAVMLILDGTTFDATNFGGNGPVADLVLRPVGTRAIGAIPMRNCTFVGCEFFMLGFTGGSVILDQILAISTPE
jgi:hypothetical protein